MTARAALFMVWLATTASSAGCFRSPKLDIESLACESDYNCPVGATCDQNLHRCSLSASGRNDGGGGDAALGSASEVRTGEPPLSIDGLSSDGLQSVDRTSDGAFGVDMPASQTGGVDGAGDSDKDTSPDGAVEMAVDAPAVDVPISGPEAGGPDVRTTGNGDAPGSGDVVSSGGATSAGGVSGSGGVSAVGGISGTAGATGTGGVLGSGGVVGSGGASESGGVPGSGGVTGSGGVSGGATGSGGTSGSGGMVSTGGTSSVASSGGIGGTGGVASTGGTLSTGGTGGTGGSSASTGWGPEIPIGQDDPGSIVDSIEPQVAVSPQGDGIVVYDGFKGGIYARYYVKATQAWSAIKQLSDGTAYARNPKVVMDGSGNAMVAWRGGQSVFARRFTASLGWDSGWASIETLYTPPSTSGLFLRDLAMTSGGDAVVGYYTFDLESGVTVESALQVYQAGWGWGTRQVLSTGPGPVVGIAKLGTTLRVVAAWTMYYTNGSGALAAVYTFDTGTHTGTLGPTQTLANQEDNGPRAVGMDDAGNAFVLIEHRLMGNNMEVLVSRYTGTWSEPYRLGSGMGYARLAVNGGGDAVVVFAQYDPYEMWAWRCASGVWQPGVQIATNVPMTDPSVSLDNSGRGLLVGKVSATVPSIFASESSPSMGWTTLHLLEQDSDVARAGPTPVSLGRTGGSGIAAWLRVSTSTSGDQVYKVMGAVYQP